MIAPHKILGNKGMLVFKNFSLWLFISLGSVKQQAVFTGSHYLLPYLNFINDSVIIVVPAVKCILIGWLDVDSCFRVLDLTRVQAFS